MGFGSVWVVLVGFVFWCVGCGDLGSAGTGLPR